MQKSHPNGIFKRPKRAFDLITILLNEHGIAEGEEAVACLLGCFISMQHELTTCKGTDKHEQCGFGKVEVSDEGIHYFKFKARQDKEVGFAAKG